MAALSADAPVTTGANTRLMKLPCTGADTFYAGAVVVYDLSGGFVQVPTGGAADEIAGIVAEQVTTTAEGDDVLVYTEGEFLLPVDSAAQGDVGDLVFRDISANTDNPADLLAAGAAATADIAIGRAIMLDGSSLWVRLHDKSTTATGA